LYLFDFAARVVPGRAARTGHKPIKKISAMAAAAVAASWKSAGGEPLGPTAASGRFSTL